MSVLQSDKTTGDIPGYPGYSFETAINEEEMDLMKLAGKESKKTGGSARWARFGDE
ncbi:hypothetical protein LEP1GSC161_3713 [Leptospira santarosai str. CBC1416]|uniref:Uncharacterized protein n=1 Tax=Leptospira santarosai str. CBC1416 TaxID=1193059 RepID=M6W319_9LEPT|nr:hypothetical protein LEP1GSC161_3713 [Leptospira santarosai str. CBC1416]